MNLSYHRPVRYGFVLAGVLAFGTLASAAPPPGMRWGDHSGLAPSTSRTRPAPTYPRLSSPPAVTYRAPVTGTTTYYYPPRVYSPALVPGVTYYYPPRPVAISPPGAPIVTTPVTVTPSAPSVPAPSVIAVPSR